MNLNFFRRSSSKLKPNFERPRYPCPFYGFNGIFDPFMDFGAFMDSGGNQCALFIEHSPCSMESPNWNKCPIADDKQNQGVFNEISKKCRVSPNEFWPQHQRSWKGLRFKNWLEYVMNDAKRPN